MTASFTVLDWFLVGGTAALAVFGLFLGFAGQVGTLAGFAAASAAGYFLHGAALECAMLLGFSAETAAMPGLVLDLVVALLAFGLARLAVKRFVRGCLGPLANTALGALVGLLVGCAAICFLAGVGSARPGTHGQSPFAENSVIVQRVAAWLDGRPGPLGGASAPGARAGSAAEPAAEDFP